jgi:hypothetical protein
MMSPIGGRSRLGCHGSLVPATLSTVAVATDTGQRLASYSRSDIVPFQS